MAAKIGPRGWGVWTGLIIGNTGKRLYIKEKEKKSTW